MIISHKYKIIFITTPKSGSHTGFKLMQDYFSAKAVRFNHIKDIPCGLEDYYSFTFIRNPYERFCALYHACVINHNKHWVPMKAKENILEYAKWYVSMHRKNAYIRPDLTSSQSYWHNRSRIKHYVHIENSQKYFDKMFPEFKVLVPHELKRNHPTWEDLKTPKLIKLVNEWADKDFKLYGYERENSNC